MNVSDILTITSADPVTREVYLHQLIDQVRAADQRHRQMYVEASIVELNEWTVIVAAAIEFLCLEFNDPVPAWTEIASASPIFIPHVADDSKAAAVLRRISPHPFSRRNVFVPANFMARC